MPSTTRLFFLLIALAGTLNCHVAFAGSLPLNSIQLDSAAQDSTGTVWATPHRDMLLTGTIYRWHENDWQKKELAPQRDYTPLLLVRGASGKVLCLWSNAAPAVSTNPWSPEARAKKPVAPDLFLTEHSGDSSRTLARFQVDLKQPRVLQDSKGIVWLTGGDNRIWKTVPDNNEPVTVKEPAYTFAPEQYRGTASSEPPAGTPAITPAPIHAVEDGSRRIWFWTFGRREANGRALRGVLFYENGAFVHRPRLDGLVDASLSWIVPLDAKRLWVVMPSVGLFQVDVATLTAMPVDAPYLDSNAVKQIQEIVPGTDGWYFITGPYGLGRLDGQLDTAETQLSYTSLWRHDGQWDRMAPGIDGASHRGSNEVSRRAWLATPEGNWVGSNSGLVFQPRRGDAKVLDWKRGYPLHTTNFLFKLNDGKLLAIESGEGSTLFGGLAEVLNNIPSPRVRVIQTTSELIRDSRGHLWTRFPHKANTLQEWDGKQWTAHEIPDRFEFNYLPELVLDNRDRLWLVQAQSDSPQFESKNAVAVFDPAQRTWNTFDNLQLALQAQQGSDISFRKWLSNQPAPFFAADGRIHYSVGQSVLHHYDGHAWQRWRYHDITGDRDGYRISSFLARNGKLSISKDKSTWQWDKTAGWSKVEYEAPPSPPKPNAIEPSETNPASLEIAAYNPRSELPSGAPLPDGWVEPTGNRPFPRTRNRYPPARDEQGAFWYSSDGQLYKAWGSMWAPWFKPDENHPFLARRAIQAVVTDKLGNAFLRLPRSGNTTYVQVAPLGPPPALAPRAIQDEVGGVTLEFATSLPPNARFVWRLDDAPWSEPTDRLRHPLGTLPPKTYRVQAVALGPDLQISQTPAVITFEVKIDAAVQIEALIARLLAPDQEARNAAVTDLARQPDRALPALRTVRAKHEGDKDKLWWIDAAIQQAEEAQRKASMRPAGVGGPTAITQP